MSVKLIAVLLGGAVFAVAALHTLFYKPYKCEDWTDEKGMLWHYCTRQNDPALH